MLGQQEAAVKVGGAGEAKQSGKWVGVVRRNTAGGSPFMISAERKRFVRGGRIWMMAALCCAASFRNHILF